MFRLRSLVPQQIFAALWLPSVCKEWDNLWARFKFICTRILSTVGGQSAVAVLFEQKHNRCHYDFLYGPTCKSWGSSSARSHASFVRLFPRGEELCFEVGKKVGEWWRGVTSPPKIDPSLASWAFSKKKVKVIAFGPLFLSHWAQKYFLSGFLQIKEWFLKAI